MAHVGEHARGPEKHVVLDHRSVVDRDVVLHLYAVADDGAAGDVAVLAEAALLADLRALLNVAECQIRVPSPIAHGSST